MARFSDLPSDVLMHILAFLPPRDIILGSRQVCLRLHRASENLSLWKGILERVCREETLLSPTFPSALTRLIYIEHAATSPSRFISKLRSSSELGLPLKAAVGQSINLEDPIIFKQRLASFISQLYLFPGGRFMLSEHKHECNVPEIHLWDLGSPGDPRGIPSRHPIASLNNRAFETYRHPPHPAHPKSDGKGVIILTHLDEEDDSGVDQWESVHIYEIDPTLESPSFRHIAEFEITNEEEIKFLIYSLTFDKAAMIINDQIIVWDFISNTAASWQVPGGDALEQIALKGEYVILFSIDSIRIWNIPRLHPAGSTFANQIQSLEPCYRSGVAVNLGEDAKRNQHWSVCLDNWYNSNSDHAVYFDKKFRNDDGTFYISSYRLILPPNTEEEESSPPTFLLGKYVEPTDGAFVDVYRLSNGYAVKSYKDFIYKSFGCGRADIRATPLDAFDLPDSSGTYKPSSLPQEYKGVSSSYLTSMCPASGRSVISLDEDDPLILIRDYIPHPFAGNL